MITLRMVDLFAEAPTLALGLDACAMIESSAGCAVLDHPSDVGAGWLSGDAVVLYRFCGLEPINLLTPTSELGHSRSSRRSGH
jgi:hypothetical protein